MRSDDSDDTGEIDATADLPQVRSGWSRWTIGGVALAALLFVALASGWFSRQQIAESLISAELGKRQISATYEIISIYADEQVLANVVIGDPAKPDFTAERVVISIRPRFGVPAIGSVRLLRPRLYATYLDGKLSFGALDTLIFTDSEEPFRLPDMRLAVEDGRALIESDFGPVGLKMAGSGNLRGGFVGNLAATAPALAVGSCALGKLTAYGQLSVSREKPRFEGPVRLGALTCEEAGPKLVDGAIVAEIKANSAFDQISASFSPALGKLSWREYRLASAAGAVDLDWRSDRLAVRYDLTGKSLETPQFQAPSIALAGQLRAVEGMSQFDLKSDISGSISKPGASMLAALDRLARASEGSLLAPLIRKAEAALRREANGATFSANLIARRRPDGDSVSVPGAVLRGSNGQALVSLSRLHVSLDDDGPRLLSGSFGTGGTGLPRISGSARRSSEDRLAANLSIADYAAGDARISMPRMALVQRGERLGFAGELRMSGAIPGGYAANLAVSLVGDWSARAGLAVGRNCAPLSFDTLRLADLELSRRALQVCPPRGGAIVRSGAGATTIAAGVPALDLAGKLGGSPIRIASGPVGFAWPGNLMARGIDVKLGAAGQTSSLRIGQLSARLGRDVSGSFDGASGGLHGVPLDISEMSGRWRYADGGLSLSQGQLKVSDREQVDRFAPLAARDAQLRLADNRITARALLREPGSDREVLVADIRHHLATGLGNADLLVDGIVFDAALQPDTLTPLALGIIANARGTVRGKGRIDWNDAVVTSTGVFSTDSLDFAAAFGPVRGTSGEIEFTDLLGLVTAPNQTLNVAAINPGIEVNDGVLTFALEPDDVLAVKGGRWPFLDGTLELRPVNITFGSKEPVRYVLDIEGIDAARFVQRLELANVAATGTFDGQLPLVFDENGGRIEVGRLVSRPPGGTVSYVGELTYEDLSPMANFAFAALRSVNYRQMAIDMDGSLEGEIITRVTFDGISQGDGASSNLVTRQIAKLPIRFRLNVRAPFIQLMTSMRSLYEPEFIRDPRSLGIVNGTRPAKPPDAPVMPPVPQALPPPSVPAASRVQPSESDGMP